MVIVKLGIVKSGKNVIIINKKTLGHSGVKDILYRVKQCIFIIQIKSSFPQIFQVATLVRFKPEANEKIILEFALCFHIFTLSYHLPNDLSKQIT